MVSPSEQYISDSPDGSLCLCWPTRLSCFLHIRSAELLTWNKQLCVQNKTSHRTTSYNQNTFRPLASSFRCTLCETERRYFIVFWGLNQKESLCALKSDWRSVVRRWQYRWTLETTQAIGLFPLLLGALTTPLHAHLLQMTLCHPSVVHWDRTEYTGRWSQLCPRGFLPPLMTSKKPQRRAVFPS